VRDGVLTVTGEDGTHDVAPPVGVPVYVLRPAAPAEVQPGDWVLEVAKAGLLYRLMPGTFADIGAGDRIAALLVLPVTR